MMTGQLLFKPHDGGFIEQRLAYREDVPRTYIPSQKAQAFSLGTSTLAHIQGGPH